MTVRFGRQLPRRRSDLGLTGIILSISEHSAGISWLRPLPAEALGAAVALPSVAAAAAQPSVAVVVEQPSVAVVVEQPSVAVVVEQPSVAVAAAPPVAAEALPFGAVAVATASLFAEPDAAAVQPGAAAQHVVSGAGFEALRLAERVPEAPQPISAAAVAAGPHSAFAPLPEPPAWFRGPGPRYPVSVDPRLADWPPADHAGQASRRNSPAVDPVRSRRAAEAAVRLWSRGPAGHWPSATPGPEAARWGRHSPASGYLAQLSDRTARRACRAWLPD